METPDVILVQEDNKPSQILVNYELDTITNLKKAKTNLKRSKEFSRKVTDDTNIRYEMHPAVYLEVKNKSKAVRRGTEVEDEEIGIKVKVTNTRSTKTKNKLDEPEYIIWFEVTDKRTGLVSRCTQKMYHTKQSVHLQGGQRMGKTTTSALMADYLEKEWSEIKEEKKAEIEYNTEVLANLNITKLQNDKKTKPNKAQTAKPKFDCPDCDFKSVFKWEIKRHVRVKHNLSINFNSQPTKRPATSPTNSVKVKKVLRFDESKNVIAPNVENPSEEEEKHESIDHFRTPPLSPTKTSPNETESGEKNISSDTVEEEVSSVIQNLENTLKTKEEKIKYLQSENQQLLNKVNTMRYENEAVKNDGKKKDEELGLVQSEYDNLFKAAQKQDKDKLKVEDDYKEASRQLGSAQRRIEELSETLKVTEEILKAQEEEEEDDNDDEEEEDSEKAEQNQLQGEDDEDYLEDEDEPGTLWQVAQKEYACKKCDEKFSGNKNFREHMQKHLKDQKKVLPCYHCEFKFTSENEFLNHIASVHGAGHICLTCNKTFKTKEEMIKHVVDTHKMKDQVKEKCVTCGEEFNKIEHLTEHIVRLHTMLSPTGQANIAGKQLVELWPLQEVGNNRNLNQNGKQCYDCGDNFRGHQQLMEHKREKHYKQKLCPFYHNQGNCRYGDQCLNIHETNQHMSTNHMQRHSSSSQDTRSYIPCRNGFNCDFKAQNRCRYSHIAPNVVNTSRTSQESVSTSVFNMQELLQSLGARLERIEQSVPDFKSMKDFPSVQEAEKRKTA